MLNGVYCEYVNRFKMGLDFMTIAWWRHDIDTFSALLSFVRGNHRLTDQ